MNNLSTPQKQKEIEADVLVEQPSKVILFNDEEHSFEEVINQIIKAIACDYSKAKAITVDAHNNGKANVFEGSMSECLKVSHTLEEIALITQIEI